MKKFNKKTVFRVNKTPKENRRPVTLHDRFRIVFDKFKSLDSKTQDVYMRLKDLNEGLDETFNYLVQIKTELSKRNNNGKN